MTPCHSMVKLVLGAENSRMLSERWNVRAENTVCLEYLLFFSSQFLTFKFKIRKQVWSTSLIVLFWGDWCQKPVRCFITPEIKIGVHKTLNWCHVLLIFGFVIFMDNSMRLFLLSCSWCKATAQLSWLLRVNQAARYKCIPWGAQLI